MLCPHQHSKMLPPCDSQCFSGLWSLSKAPNPSATSYGHHGNPALALRLVLNEDLAPNFFFWTEVVETTNKVFVYLHTQQDKHNKRKPNSSCPLQGLRVISHLDCRAELRRALDYDLSLTCILKTALLVEKNPNNGIFSSFSKIGQRTFQGVSCCPSHLFTFCLLASLWHLCFFSPAFKSR